MTFCDFTLLGCSVALTVIMLWPDLPDQQWVGITRETGHHQRYSVPINDPSLQVLKQRLAKWETPTTTRALRIARWHHELADYYCQLDPADPVGKVAQVSYSDAGRPRTVATPDRIWAKVKQNAQLRIAREEQEIKQRQENAVPPVVLGPTISSIRSPAAFSLAFLAAVGTVAFLAWRQRVRPPITLDGETNLTHFSSQSGPTTLQIPNSWVRIRQPLEVVLWRIIYRSAVVSAGICLTLASIS
jgi:hypothetical protein